MATVVNPAGLSPTFSSLSISTSSQTGFSSDNTVAHGTTPLIDLYHDAATVANDYAYELDLNAQNSTPAKKTFASLQSQVSVNTASSEMGTHLVNTINAGSMQVNMQFGNNLGQYRGTQKNTTPPAGFIGETMRATGSNVSMTTNTPVNITSITLTAGNWLVYGGLSVAGASSPVTTYMSLSISQTTGAEGTKGDNMVTTPTGPAGSVRSGLSVPAVYLSLSGSTTVYLVANAIYTPGTLTGNGRISATRVG